MTTCSHTGCSREATCIPHLMLPAKGWPTDVTACGFALQLPLCNRHFVLMEFEQKKSGANNPALVEMAKRVPMTKIGGATSEPDWSRAYFVKIKTGSKKHREFEAMWARQQTKEQADAPAAVR